MKRFIFDTLLQAEEICNLKREADLINQGIAAKTKLVIYGRRNTGKTSLVKNVIIPQFKKENPKGFVLFCDLMQVKDMTSLNHRIYQSFLESFKLSFPGKSLWNHVTRFLGSMKPIIQLDPLTGETSLSLSQAPQSIPSLSEIFSLMTHKIFPEVPGLMVLDEFQDISSIPEAEGIMRGLLQEMRHVPMVIMGSKKHLLSEMFAKPQAPFSDFGSDMEFQDIPYGEYHAYMMERFLPVGIQLSLEHAQIWQDLLFRSPEAVNCIGDYIQRNFADHTLTESEIRLAISHVVKNRSSRFEEYLGQFSSAQEQVLVALAKYGPIQEPSSKDFLKKVSLSHATVLKSVKKLYDDGILEMTPTGYRLMNPLLNYYIQIFR